MACIEQILSIEYHENGVGGEHFFVVLFEPTQHSVGSEPTNTPMVAIVFPSEGTDLCHTAVMALPKLAAGHISHENSWMGDFYDAELREAIRLWEAERVAASKPRVERVATDNPSWSDKAIRDNQGRNWLTGNIDPTPNK